MKSKKHIFIFLFFSLFLVSYIYSGYDFFLSEKYNLAALGSSSLQGQSKTHIVFSFKHSLAGGFSVEDIAFSNYYYLGDREYLDDYELRLLDSSGRILSKRTFAISHTVQVESFGVDDMSSSFVDISDLYFEVPVPLFSDAKKIVVVNQKTGAVEFTQDISTLVEQYFFVEDYFAKKEPPAFTVPESKIGLTLSYPIIEKISLPGSVLGEGRNVLARFVVGSSKDGDLVLRKFRVSLSTEDVVLSDIKAEVFDSALFTGDGIGLQVGSTYLNKSNLRSGKYFNFYGPIVIPAGTEKYIQISANISKISDQSIVKTILLHDSVGPKDILSRVSFLNSVEMSNFIWSPYSGGIPYDFEPFWTNSYYSVGLSDKSIEFLLGR